MEAGSLEVSTYVLTFLTRTTVRNFILSAVAYKELLSCKTFFSPCNALIVHYVSTERLPERDI